MAIYLYTGEGAGKTTNALGLALRSLGHKHKVIIIQFLKWWKNTGEYKFQKIKGISKYYKIYQFGRKGWHGFKNLTKQDKELAQKALDFALEITKKEKPNFLILDEINLAAYLKLIDTKRVIETIKKIKKMKKDIDIILIGRYAPKDLIDFSDFANEISIIKMPKKIKAKRGIQY
ncbi:MAG: cob(I)yrinic acid a,c-diamide adenosyltransferase [Candidatus Pacearchaeota archaeon]|nr:cob(I)yrinic acid a,c-diamide adenosyltransferase [Candidatus Pacearchaeota archaeon]